MTGLEKIKTTDLILQYDKIYSADISDKTAEEMQYMQDIARNIAEELNVRAENGEDLGFIG